MKILNLILYSKSDDYDEMYNLQSNYLKFIKENLDIDYYFYCYDDIQEDYKIINDIIYIKGEESYLPGVLDKTIKSFELFINDNYDYIIRSNISTVLNFELLIHFLNNNKIDYCGNIIKLKWIDEDCGIIDETYYNEKYASGTSIILSNRAVNYLINNKNNLDNTIIDDISIGVLLNKKFNLVDINKYCMINSTEKTNTKLFTIDRYYHKSILLYRNKTFKRIYDIHFMKNNINDLVNNFNNYELDNKNNCIIVYNDDNDNLLKCCKKIRKYYNEEIIIINNKNIDLDIDNYKIIVSDYYLIGIISAYYHFHQLNLYKKALIINSSTNINKYININNIYKLKPLKTNDLIFDNLEKILKDFSLSNELIDYIEVNKQIQYINCEIIIDYNILDLINKRHNFFNIILNNIIYIKYDSVITDILIGSIFNKYKYN
jgi:hypothetical protein